MIIPEDKLKHLTLAALMLAYSCIVVWLYQDYGAGPAAAFSTTGGGIAYEVQQRVRREGCFSWMDALATAVPGWVVWAALLLQPLLQTHIFPR